MGKVGWLFFTLFIIGLSGGIYFYKTKYVPLLEENKALKKENKNLKTEFLAELKSLKTVTSNIPKQEAQKEAKKEPLKFEFKLSDFFAKNSTKLSTKGKEIISNIIKTLENENFEEIEILLYPQSKLQVRRALNIKAYFVRKGINKNSVWAWVKNSGKRDKVIITVKWSV